jgi:uncharacterized protein (DUF1919 family)
MKPNLLYCYNPTQANYFLQNGLVPLEIGKGNKGDIYVLFSRSEKFEEIFSKWSQRGKEMKSAI